MSDPLRELSLRYDGPIPPHERAAARYGPRAHERITAAGDAAWLAWSLKSAGILLKKAVRDERAGNERAAETKARLLHYCKDTAARWRRYRNRYREIMREIALLEADRARGLYQHAAE